MAKTETASPAAAQKRINWVEAQHKAFVNAIREVGQSLKAEINAMLASPEVAMAGSAALADAVYLQSSIAAQLDRAGYPRLAQQFVGRLDGAKLNILATLAAAGVTTTRLSVFDEGALALLKSLDLAYLRNLGQRAVADITRGIVHSTLAGTGRVEVIKRVSETVDRSLVGQASTYYDTALSTFDREAMWQAGAAAGVAKWLYYGPNDIKTRQFCRERVGREFTMAEIEKMRNGTRLEPVSRFGGGWNCRHIWHPVPEEDDEAKANDPAPLPPSTSLPTTPKAAAEAIARFKGARGDAYQQLVGLQTRLNRDPANPSLMADVATARQAFLVADAQLKQAQAIAKAQKAQAKAKAA